MPIDDDAIGALQRAYLAAVYRARLQDGWQGIRIGEPAPGIEAALPQARCFGLLSAWNPRSVPRPETINRADDARLRAAIRACGWDGAPACAAADDGGWREPGWLVPDIGTRDLDALARRFGQLGTLHWRRGEPVRLRMNARRPPSLEPHPHVDWIQ